MITTTIPTAEPAAPQPGTGHLGQTFLVGEEVYLRGIETADAAVAMSWRDTLFPVSPELTEEWIKDDLPKEEHTTTFAIVRKADDRVVGAVKLHGLDVHHWMWAKVDPLHGERGHHWKGEALVLVAEWITGERGQASVVVELAGHETVAIGYLERAGLRQSARFREMLVDDGCRVDKLMYERLNPAWVARLGDPNDVPLERTGLGEARPVPPPVARAGDPPRNAMMVGPRVYLRPEEKADAPISALSARRETETFFDIGRHLTSSVQFATWIRGHEKKELPGWITFAACLRETDEPIGWVALLDVDYQHRYAETGSFFGNTAYRGGGYGSEAKHLLLEYAFDRLGLHMVQSWVYFQNTRSAAALRKQGYREAGQINWVYPNRGTLDNFIVFDLLADEWRALPRRAWDETPGS